MCRRPGRAETNGAWHVWPGWNGSRRDGGHDLELDDERVCRPDRLCRGCARTSSKRDNQRDRDSLLCTPRAASAPACPSDGSSTGRLPSLSMCIGQNTAVFAAPVNLVFAVAQKDLRDANPRCTCWSSKAVTSLT